MIPADEMAAKIELTKRPSTDAVAGSIDKLDEQLRVSVEALLHPSPPRKPVQELNDLLLAISHRLDQESSERKAIDSRLAAIESKMKRRSSRGLARYVVAICIGVAAILAWQSYGQAAKRVIATRAPELGWSPETKAEDRELGRAARLDAAPGRFCRPCCSAVRARNGNGHFKSARRSFSRSAASTAADRG